MNVKKEQICRLCVKVANSDFKEIDEITKQLFSILLLKLDLNIIKDPIICQDCVAVGKRCLAFKSTCICTEQIILSYSIHIKRARYNIKVICEEEEREETVDDDFGICRICMARLDKNNVDPLTNQNTFKMLSEYIPEMDFNIIDDPIVCVTCREDLQVYSKFVLNCLDIEAKIKAYCREEGTDDMGQVMLSKILNFFLKDMKYPGECSQKCIIKEELNTYENTECVYSGLVKLKEEELIINEEKIYLNENSYDSLPEIRLDNCDDMFRIIKETSNTFDNTEGVYSGLMKLQEEKLINEEKINFNENSCENLPEMRLDNCDMFRPNEYSTKTEFNIISLKTRKCNTNHTKSSSSHIDVSEIRPYKCSFCTYRAKRKSHLEQHTLVHKDSSEIIMYKCSLCAYETKHESSLKPHMLVHKDVSEINMNKCSLCAHEANQRSNLQTHMLVHKEVSDIKMYKCSSCAYESKRKSHLERHMLVHKDVSEIKMFKCTLCTYEAKRKGHLERHTLVHSDASDMKMYKCSMCAYEAKMKSFLNQHIYSYK